MIDELDRRTDLASDLTRRARAAGVGLIWRAQARRTSRVLVQSGRAEETGVSTASGHGVQVVTPEGYTALGSRDDFDPGAAANLLDRVIGIAAHGPDLGLTRVPAASSEALRARDVPEGLEAFERLDLEAARNRLIDLEREIASRVEGVTLRLAFGTDLDGWRVVRDDGTDVTFAMPRCTMRMTASNEGSGDRHSVGASVSGPLPDLPWNDATVAKFLERALAAARLATRLPDAPNHPSGSFPILMDYALAKGLAHEAFGHASEADGFRSSILAKDGKFRAGDRVGPAHVSVIDEPVRGDHAFQPFSANGVRRRRATIVDHGHLKDALTDAWTSASAGTSLTGAERAESFRSAPLPRMTNIRIEVDAPIPAPGAFEDYGPEEVRELLASAGIFRRHPEVVFLSGYSGGQVNTVTGDFVFNCKSIYRLGHSGATLYKPAIFSGSMFGALGAIREAFGPLALDAIGTCGKWGQSVPSSGGSHWFVFLEPEPSVRLGGR
ncbi:MAG TPA: metallopeptidase TldD-related protein [Candidatus Polarisedimenticolaceae bacterium]